jgi:hypothetical protein
MNSDGDKIYMKIVAFDEIYNFVVQTFSFEVILWIQIWVVYRFFYIKTSSMMGNFGPVYRCEIRWPIEDGLPCEIRWPMAQLYF